MNPNGPRSAASVSFPSIWSSRQELPLRASLKVTALLDTSALATDTLDAFTDSGRSIGSETWPLASTPSWTSTPVMDQPRHREAVTQEIGQREIGFGMVDGGQGLVRRPDADATDGDAGRGRKWMSISPETRTGVPNASLASASICGRRSDQSMK